ncbi:cell division protein FtsB [Wenzhouxiangella marina]|uniref:Cell division protein FtsB n=1 Tax=Wenzhouxiangella marina TaxID=1579979 RepID=A0A0K0XYN5_9GAMM|nr:cell division protein FtsB [Wenzhouxiangella marina]AKS42785.1 cell division protein FtsB [Wenzhouxiangella marina]MBB6087537.1 cell division protein FtsB [Wenzhouxiangella marina]
MRVVLIILFVLLVVFQFRLWREVSEVRDLRGMVEQQLEENEGLRQRNEALAAEVEDLREGLAAIEERARSELGLIREGEEFFLIVDPEQVEPEP